MTGVEQEVREEGGATDGANYARAILNILDDFTEERGRQSDTQRAVINILEDMETEKVRLESTQKALVNILDDFDVERIRVEEANSGLHTVNEAMRGFIAVAAHDLRSPLASIVGFSALLVESWDTLTEENRRKFVATIDRQSHNLSLLVDDLFTLSSIEAGALNTAPKLVSLAEAIERCLELSNGDTASVLVSCSRDLIVRVDPHHLGRIMDNYLQNAFKYGEPPLHIEAARVGPTRGQSNRVESNRVDAVGPTSEMVEVRVVDHGPGVPPEFVPRLFGKFARADVPSTRALKGTGLGLSIVRGLAEVNGGQALYEPNAPNGSCFIFRLPVGEPGA